MIVVVPNAGRNTVDPADLADLTAVGVVGISQIGKGIAIEFSDDVDPAARAAIVARLSCATDAEANMRAQAEAALVDCRAFLANTTPTSADVVAQVRLLTRICIALIRLVLRKIDQEG